jgi:hypothetical protein
MKAVEVFWIRCLGWKEFFFSDTLNGEWECIQGLISARGPHARPHVAYSMVSTSHGGGALVVVVVMGEKSRGQTRGLPLLGVI